MTTEQAQATIDRWHATLDERAAQARLTGLPRGYMGQLFPNVFEAPEYWQARHVLGIDSDEDYQRVLDEVSAARSEPKFGRSR